MGIMREVLLKIVRGDSENADFSRQQLLAIIEYVFLCTTTFEIYLENRIHGMV